MGKRMFFIPVKQQYQTLRALFWKLESRVTAIKLDKAFTKK